MVVTEKLVLEPIFGTKVSITANSSPHAVMLGCVGRLGIPSELIKKYSLSVQWNPSIADTIGDQQFCFL